MIEISFFGVLAGTFVSALSVVLLLVAVGAVAYLGLTTFTATTLHLGPGRTAESSTGVALRRTGRRFAPRAGIVASIASLVFTLAGLRFHDAASSAGTWLFTAAVAIVASTAAGAWCAALSLAAFRSVARLADSSAERRARIEGASRTAILEVQAKTSLFLAGDDLRAEVKNAETALSHLGEALTTLTTISAGLRARRESTGTQQGDAALAEEHASLETDVARKVELGKQIHTEAETAVFRLRCLEPLRRLVRQRPRDATATLGTPTTSPETLRTSVARALPAVARFLEDAHKTGEALSALEPSRPSHLDPADPADPLTRARRELSAIQTAYAAVLRRVEVVALRLDADARLHEMTTAADALSPSAHIAGLDETELDQLIEEVTRADAALTLDLPDTLEAHTVSEALARTTAALERNDARSLDDLARAMKDIE